MKTFDQIRDEAKSITEASATPGDHEDAAHAHRTASKQPKMDLRAVKAHEKAAEHHDTAAKHLKTGNAYAAQNAHINAKNEADKAKDHGNVHSKRAHADTRAIGEGYASAAQRKAIWANKADGGKGHPDNKKEAKSADLKPEKYTDANGKTKIRMVPVTREDTVNELDTSTLVSYRKKANKQRYSNDISKRGKRTDGVDRADKKLRKRNIDKFGNPTEDTSDAVKAFLAKGGKIKKLPPAKAQGYHGKDDPGSDVHGLISKPDTKDMGTRKKVKSMEGVSESMLGMRGSERLNGGKSKDPRFKSSASHIDYHHRQAGGHQLPGGDADSHRYKTAKKLGYRVEAVKPTKAMHVFDNEKDARAKAKDIDGKYVKGTGKSDGKHAAIKEISQDTKKSYIKKAADDMSKQADKMARAQRGDGKMDKAVNKFVNRRKGIARAVEAKETDPPFDNAKKISTTPTKDQFGNVIKNRAKSLARAAAKKAGGDMGDKQKKESVNELDQKTMNSYYGKAQRSKDKATNSAVATILRKGDHSKDLQTRNKRDKGMALAKTRTLKSIRGDK